MPSWQRLYDPMNGQKDQPAQIDGKMMISRQADGQTDIQKLHLVYLGHGDVALRRGQTCHDGSLQDDPGLHPPRHRNCRSAPGCWADEQTHQLTTVRWTSQTCVLHAGMSLHWLARRADFSSPASGGLASGPVSQSNTRTHTRTHTHAHAHAHAHTLARMNTRAHMHTQAQGPTWIFMVPGCPGHCSFRPDRRRLETGRLVPFREGTASKGPADTASPFVSVSASRGA
jgi:hypothetical protein